MIERRCVAAPAATAEATPLESCETLLAIGHARRRGRRAAAAEGVARAHKLAPGVLHDHRPQARFIGASQIVDLVLLDERLKGGHGAHGVRARCLLIFVHIDLDEGRLWELLGEGFEDWADPLARATPRGREVDKGGGRRGGILREECVELVFGGDLAHWCRVDGWGARKT